MYSSYLVIVPVSHRTPVFIYLYFKLGWHPLSFIFKDEEDHCPKCGKPLDFSGERCDWCGHEITREAEVTSTVERRSTKRSFIDRLKGKKICDDCGTELVYKENMHSWYCPTCHSYKESK